MTVTPLSSRDHHRTPTPTGPRGRLSAARPRRIRTVDSRAEPAAVTITVEITLAGERRYADALEVIDTLREVTDPLGTASMDITPAVAAEKMDAEEYDAAEAYVGTSSLRVIPNQSHSAQDLAGEDQAAAADPDDGLIQIMADSRIVVVAGEPMSLTRMEFDLLIFLAEHPRRVFGRPQLLKNVWGYEHNGERTGIRTVDVHIRRLRAKLGASLFTTVRSVGYRLADEANIRVARLR